MLIRNKTVIMGTIALLICFFHVTALSENIINNPSFEILEDENPKAWDTRRWQGNGTLSLDTKSKTGEKSVKIESTRGGDLSWYIIVEVKPFSKYKLSGWIKTENLETDNSEGALLNLHNLQGVRTNALTGTNDWTKVETEFETEDQDSIHINCLFGGWGLATGTAWYDDIALELISSPSMEPSIVINAEKEGHPVSPYIYGQFIEHLGRCIYGGIWAEMLQDRKFYESVGSDNSPWEIIGPSKNVRMFKQHDDYKCYVGEHTPLMELDESSTECGIEQSELGLVEGKEYVGRIILAGEEDAAPVKVSLVWGPEPWDRQIIIIESIQKEYKKYPLEFTAKKATNNGRLEIVSAGKGELVIGTLSLMPADNIKGMRADTLKLLKELNAPIYRWPGGNFVSGYDWKDGIGERDKRPPRKNPAWQGIEHNDFGLDEFIVFCRELDTEPLIVVNSGLGGVEMALEELQYTNGLADTPMGKWRAENGNPQPYNVKWWGVGNEMYGDWQLGHMPLEDYVKKHNQFADVMWEMEPTIKLIAVGAVGNWSETMMRHCADHMNLISEHFYCQERPGLISHVRQIPNNIKRIADAHRRYRETIDGLAEKDIRISLDEWNYWYGPHIYGELGTRYFLKDALGIAAGLNEYVRNSDIMFMANYAQTVNVIGCIKTNKTDAVFATTGLPLKLYREHFGSIPVQIEGDSFPLDVAVAWSEDRSSLTIGIVNPMKESMTLPFELKGIALTGKGTVWQITSSNEMAYNEPGKEPNVQIVKSDVEGVEDELLLPPISISLYRLPVK